MTTISPISTQEMERRWALARRVMKDHGLDAIVMQAREDWMGGYVRWFTDIPAMNGYPRSVIFYADAPMTLVEMGAFGFEKQLGGTDPVNRGVGAVYGTPSFVSILQSSDYDAELVTADLIRHGAKRIGTLCPGALPSSLIKGLEGIEGARSVDITDALDHAKAVKSPEEIGLIKQTALLQDQVFAEVCDFIRPGLTDRDVMAHAEATGRRLGSDQGIYLGCSAPLGTPSRFVGRHFQSRELQSGDHLSILIEVNGPGGIYLEIARTMVLGAASDHLLQAFENVKAAQDYSLSLMKPGAAPAEVFAAHNAWMASKGLPEETRLYAHGQGCEMVERPLIRQDETMPLAEGMLLAVHPGYFDDEVFAVICDNYMVEAHGMGPCLHETEKRIFEVSGR
ncbi:M24 family metallopeptidase [Alphaproteobacteria bacterium KMM 3653]|uniref:M24 family metallopeptidase n=1 Tax=Harenicola maris TaxID=2841044 RepID=A0AAP2G3C3_9RHOB|nr:M24 family metallopeptidase [Harenicola maris]